jgi:Family of unknown function (DUF6206)
MEPLWRIVAELTDSILQIDAPALRGACYRWTCGGAQAQYIADRLVGADGVRSRAEREAVFLAARRACRDDPTPERVATLARGAAAFAEDLAMDVRQFRRALSELRAAARAPLELRVYGFGEISRTVGLVRRAPALAETIEPSPFVYKRLAPFPSRELAAQYVRTYEEYNRRLRDDVGIEVPDFHCRTMINKRGRTVVLPAQARLDPSSIAKRVLQQRDAHQCLILFRMVLAEYRKLVRYNRAKAADGFQIGLDGQVPNWAVRNYLGDQVPLRGDEGLIFVDTNTPMMRMHGRECLPMTFYLQSLPRMIRPFVRPMARSVLNRYFNPRIILLDFLANTSIHGRGELVECFLPDGNSFLAEGLIQPVPRPITMADVKKYIKDDVATWRLMRSARKVEEMLQGQRGPVATVREIHRIYTQPIF